MPENQEVTKKMVLVIEDDETFRSLLIQILKNEDFDVRSAENGLVAKTILALNENKFDLVISDVRMPEMDGASLLRAVRSQHPNTKFILMTGFSEILEAKHAFELGADEFLPKPFKMTELLAAIEKVFKEKEKGPAAAGALDEDDFSFCKIHVDEFTSSSTLPSDIYIRLTENKFIKVAKEGARIHLERIQTYKEKKVEYFYVHVKDFSKYAGFALKIARVAAASKVISREQKIKIFKHTSEILLNKVFVNGLNPEDIDFSKNVIHNAMATIGTEPAVMDLALLLQSHSDETYTQSVAVSIYSCLIAKKLNWTGQQTMMKLALGGLFHDVGKKEISASILAKSRIEMTSEEIKIYESHPQRGKEILSSIPGFPSDVVQIAFQHHENQLGTGYPLGLPPLRVHPLAKLIHVTDEFFHACQQYNGKDPKPWMLAIRELWEMKGSELDPLMLKALMELFNYPIPGPLLKVKAS